MNDFFKSIKYSQIETVRRNAFNIEFIKEPSEELKLLAVKQNWYAIKYIKNPSEIVQLEAVKNYYSNYNKYSDFYYKRAEGYITSPKAKELYNKLKKMKEITK